MMNGQTLPETFIPSLHQLFSILDKTKSGYVPFNIFKRYFDSSSSTLNFLNELEFESKSTNYLITFDLLINVIQRSLSSIKQPPTIFLPNKVEREIPIIYQNSNFSMIRALKRYEIECNLLKQTCQTIDRVKYYLNDCLYEMKDKRKIYRNHISTAETTGIAIESMYNRDLVADLLKLAETVIKDGNYDFKKSSSSLNLQKQLQAKEDHIKQLETENRVLLKELLEMKHQ